MKERAVLSKTYYKGRLIQLKVDNILFKGKEINRAVVVHPGAVAVVPFLDKENVLLVKQYRYPIKRVLLELPAGTLEKGEPPHACANRELIEETGYSAKKMIKAASFYLAPGYSSELIHLFIAIDLTFVGQRNEPDEGIKVEAKNIYQAIKEIVTKKYRCDAKTVCGLYFALEYLKKVT